MIIHILQCVGGCGVHEARPLQLVHEKVGIAEVGYPFDGSRS